MKFLDAPLPPPLVDALRSCRPHLVAAAVFSAFINILLLAPTIYMMQVYDRVVPTGGRLTLLYLTLVVAFALATQTGLESVRSRLLTLAGPSPGPAAGRRHPAEADERHGPQGVGPGHARIRPGAPGDVGAGGRGDHGYPVDADLRAGGLHDPPGPGRDDHRRRRGAGGAGGGQRAGHANRAREAFVAQAQAYASQEAAAANGEVVRALGMRGALRERQLADRRAGLDLSAKAQFTGGGYSAATKFTRMFLQSAALGLGAWLAVDKQISAGAIIAASVLMSRALQPIEQLVGSWGLVGQARGALNNLIKLFPTQGRGEVSAPSCRPRPGP